MSSSYFEHDADIGIFSRGLTVEQSFEAAEMAVQAGLARRVAFLRLKVCVKG